MEELEMRIEEFIYEFTGMSKIIPAYIVETFFLLLLYLGFVFIIFFIIAGSELVDDLHYRIKKRKSRISEDDTSKKSEKGKAKTMKVIRIGWIQCPACGGETRCKMRQDTVITNFPLYCPLCGKDTLVSVSNLTVTVVGSGDDPKTEDSGIAEVRRK